MCDPHYTRERLAKLGPCIVDGCDTQQQVTGLCLRHYHRKRRWGTTDEPAPTPPLGACSVEGCDGTVKSRDLCGMHLQRWYRFGSTDPRPRSETKVCRECNKAWPRAQFPTTVPVCEYCYPTYTLIKHGPCAVDGCERVIKARGWCELHLARFYARGTTDAPEQKSTMLCGRCDKQVPRGEYDMKQTACKRCRPFVRQELNARRLSRASGVTRTAAELRQAQDGRCAICGVPEAEAPRARLAVDHDHDSNRIRGLLCNNCNCGLGHFKDSPSRMLAAIEYLARTGSAKEAS
jgi:hypothetical protein